jgi:hypothetical protein
VITEELRTYIDMVRLEESQDLIHEMANVGPRRHGIENVYIFDYSSSMELDIDKLDRIPIIYKRLFDKSPIYNIQMKIEKNK